MSDMISQKEFQKRMKKLKVPKGFQLDLEIESRGWKDHPIPTMVYVLKNDTVELRFDQTGSGHTIFKDGDGQRTFDQRGVEDSFYHLPLWNGDRTRYNLNTIVKEQLERVAEYFEYKKTAVSVPGLPHTVSPENKKKLTHRLSVHGTITLLPSGFGTGYVITTDRKRDSTVASAELAAFFGMKRGQVFISTIECD